MKWSSTNEVTMTALLGYTGTHVSPRFQMQEGNVCGASNKWYSYIVQSTYYSDYLLEMFVLKIIFF